MSSKWNPNLGRLNCFSIITSYLADSVSPKKRPMDSNVLFHLQAHHLSKGVGSCGRFAVKLLLWVFTLAMHPTHVKQDPWIWYAKSARQLTLGLELRASQSRSSTGEKGRKVYWQDRYVQQVHERSISLSKTSRHRKLTEMCSHLLTLWTFRKQQGNHLHHQLLCSFQGHRWKL